MLNVPSMFRPPSMFGPPSMFSGVIQAATGVESGWCLSFDGSDDYVAVGSSATYAPSTSTYTCWIHTSNAGSSYRNIICKDVNVGLNCASNVLGVYDWSGGGQKSTGINIADGLWHHVAFVRNAGVTNGSYIYIDGTLRLTLTYVSNTGTGNLSIGANGGGGENFAGRIDDVRIYSRALSATEIGYLANNTQNVTTGLELYMPLEEGTGTTTTIYGSDGVTQIGTGTLTNGPVWHPQTPPKLVSGRETLTHSLSFDGSNDYVDLGTTDWLSGSAASLSLWFKHTSASGTHRLFAKEPSDYLTSFSIYGNMHFFTSKTSGGLAFADAFTGVVGVNNGLWHSVIATVDSANIKLYYDGVLVNTTSWTHGILSSTARTLIGASYYIGVAQFFYGGKLADVSGYARTLSAEDVRRIARGQRPVTDDPVGRWKLNETSGDTVIDYGSGGNNGTKVNGPTPVADVSPWLSA